MNMQMHDRTCWRSCAPYHTFCALQLGWVHDPPEPESTEPAVLPVTQSEGWSRASVHSMCFVCNTSCRRTNADHSTMKLFLHASHLAKTCRTSSRRFFELSKHCTVAASQDDDLQTPSQLQTLLPHHRQALVDHTTVRNPSVQNTDQNTQAAHHNSPGVKNSPVPRKRTTKRLPENYLPARRHRIQEIAQNWN